MAAKKTKSKQNVSARQKVEIAQKKKDFFKLFKQVCDRIHPDLYDTFTQVQRDVLFELRGMSAKIVPHGKVSKQVMLFAYEFARIAQKEMSIPIVEGGAMISIKEFHQIIIPIEVLLIPVKTNDLYPNIAMLVGKPWYEEYKKAFDDREKSYFKAMDNLRGSIRLFMSDLRYMLFYVNSNMHTNKTLRNDHRIRHEISLQAFRPERKKIKLASGETRNGIRFTLASPYDNENENDKFVPAIIPASLLGLKYMSADELYLPVYVTEHTLNRLEERIADIRFKGYAQLEILTALTDEASKRQIIRMKDNRLLVEYRLLNFKIGYLVVSIQEDVVLVRTFLLLTGNMTPEGKILREQLGLQKLDNQYLGIDKLSTFLNSDILDNEDICALFVKAGCGPLLDLCRKLKNDPAWQENEEKIQLAAQMRDYLSKGEPEEWTMPEA
jgi:hypothetical protein